MRNVFASFTASWETQTASFLSQRWHGFLPSHRTFEVRQLTQALMARRFRGRCSGELEQAEFIGNFVRWRSLRETLHAVAVLLVQQKISQ